MPIVTVFTYPLTLKRRAYDVGLRDVENSVVARFLCASGEGPHSPLCLPMGVKVRCQPGERLLRSCAPAADVR
jgi:hypothetical protein